MITIEQTRLDACLYCWVFFRKCKRECPMFASQREKWADDQIIAIVELDVQKFRVRIVLAREAIRERLRELEDCTNNPQVAKSE